MACLLTMLAALKVSSEQHLNENSQSYLDHLADSWRFALFSGLACCSFVVHGLVPGLFDKRGSGFIAQVHSEIQGKQCKEE
jgi:Family of unknown function (DUF6356)